MQKLIHQITAATAVLLLCSVSTLCSIQFWQSVATHSGMLSTSAAACVAVALQLCLYLFAYHAKYASTIQSQCILYNLTAALFFVSALASVLFMQNSTHTARQAAKTTSIEYQVGIQMLEDLGKQMKSQQKVAELDIEKGFRQRGAQLLNKLQPLQQQRKTVAKSLHQSSNGQTTGFDSVIPTKYQTSLFITLSILIDACSLAALSLLAAKPPMPIKQQSSNADKPHKKEQPNKKSKESTAFTEQQKQAMDSIIAGEYGNSPSQRKVIDKTKLRHAQVKPIFEHLIEYKILRKNGQKYELIQEAFNYA